MDRHCSNKNISQMHKDRFFYKHSDSTFELLKEYRLEQTIVYEVKQPTMSELQADSCIRQNNELAIVQNEKAKREILEHLRSVSPQLFENFSRHFLSRYGFTNMQVTSFSRDGGIDVKGALKMGIAKMGGYSPM
ncbi:restriction endonuclease [uncultured Shewanella sp.]|uniref:restriction endonuclease n=1 Tax=uncultured Shewanella sp. TaxID=173975 RepID=UPI00261809D4|nr:restriction endonuclease [uncultured Shewanella sp.]